MRNLESRQLNTIVKQFSEALKNNLLAAGKDATGRLISSINTEIEYDGRYFSVELNTADYFKYVNEGRKAGKFPPLNAIRQWITVKGILPRPIKGKLPTTNQLAYLIGRKISRQGIKGTHSLEKTEKNYRLEDRILDQLLEVFEKEIDKSIKEFHEME